MALTISHTISIRMMKGEIREQNKTPQKDEHHERMIEVNTKMMKIQTELGDIIIQRSSDPDSPGFCIDFKKAGEGHITPMCRAEATPDSNGKVDTIRLLVWDGQEDYDKEFIYAEKQLEQLKNDIVRMLEHSVSDEYVKLIMEARDDLSGNTLLDDIVANVQEASSWSWNGQYNDTDIRYAIGREILARLGE